MDSHRTTTYRRNPGFLERIGSSLVGILVGLALLLIASALLFWNEGRAVQTAKSLDEGMNMVVSLKTIDVASRDNNGKLVHLIGPLRTDNILYDETYGVSVHAVKLKRTVEMYQWVEHETKTEFNEGGQTRVETSYSYSKEWRSELVWSNSFSDGFNHRNPITMQVENKNSEAFRVNVGQFELSKGLINRISEFHPLPLSYLRPSQDPHVRIFNGFFYHSAEPLYPLVGDLRVRFEYAGISGESPLGPLTQVSIIARQLGSELLPYKTLAGDDLELLYYGQLSPEEIFNKEKIQNTMVTWGIRFGGWLLMFIGFSLITSLITTIGN
ncbi:hypothetical protein ACJMK2_017242 [Sinanodonta woodiana]|uniref:RING-type E3 ubiquitin transferase n=1 Tax=Sinanodonta woodiana TaxID=1069815 RepID=A0ABD3UW98_SINWO